MKDMIETLIYWKNRAEQQELMHDRLVEYLKTKHPRVWQGWSQRLLHDVIYGPEEKIVETKKTE